MNQKIIVGIGGLARSGKDTLCQLLIEKLKEYNVQAKRRALADELKDNIRGQLIQDYGIDVLNCTPEQKEIIRPALVAYGKEKRETSKGAYWTGIVERKMQEDVEQVIIVPDIRYLQFPEDEAHWVKNRGGLLIHVSRYTTQGEERVWLQPPNEDEKINDPLVRAAADVSLTWETVTKLENLSTDCLGFLTTTCLFIVHKLEDAKRRAANQ